MSMSSTGPPGGSTLPTMLSNLGDAKVLGMLQQHQRNCNAAAVLSQAPAFSLGGLNPTSLSPLSNLPTSTTDLAALTFLTNLAAASVNPSTGNYQLSSAVTGGNGNVSGGGGGALGTGTGTGAGSLSSRMAAGGCGLGGMGNGNYNGLFSVRNIGKKFNYFKLIAYFEGFFFDMGKFRSKVRMEPTSLFTIYPRSSRMLICSKHFYHLVL